MDRPSNRSPSPLNPRTNPNLRKSESNSNVRRSFNDNPFGGRPSGRFVNPITPADQLRRHSLGKEGDEKENEKAARFRSPAKGSKHFMSPTISAASKFTPSPRKKVLAERNEIVRTSIQFSDFHGPDLMEDSCVKPEKMLDRVVKEGSFDSKVDQKEVIVEVPIVVHQVTLDSGMNENSDCVSCTKKKVSFSDNSPIIIAPLDADPSHPPYDPETNFLSPRPQFLHYRPNPRIEVFLNKENGDEFGECCGGMRLEDSFIMSEESQSEDSQKESEESQSEDSQKESEDLSSSETISEEESEPIIVSEPNLIMSEESSEDSPKESEDFSFISEEDGELIISEPNPISPISSLTPEPIIEAISFISEEDGELIISEPNPISPISSLTPEPIIEAKRSPKPRFFKRAISISLFLVFVIACVSISVTDSPVMNSPVLKDFNLSKLYDSSEVAASAKSNLNELARNFRQWSANSISYLSGLVPHISQSYEFGPIQFANLTDVVLQEDLLVDRFNGVSRDDEFEETQEEEEWETVSEEEDKVEDEVENAISVEEDQPVLEPQVAEILAEEESVDIKLEADELPELESEQKISDDVSHKLVAADQTVEDTTKVERELSSETEIAPTEPPQSTVEDDTKFELSSENSPSGTEPIPSTLISATDKFPSQNILGVFFLVFSLAAATIFIYRRPKKTGVSSDVTQELSKEPVISKQVPQNWEADIDVDAESFASEMSSFQKSSYTKRGLRKETNQEAQSHEKRARTNNKRESLASSSSEFSMGSLSYGSFTTYERIPIKKASGEEEIVTPVRRSSRIRSHIISP